MKELRYFALKWQDTKEVYVLSTTAKPGVEDVRRKEKGQLESVVKQCPSVVVHYHKYMGGVETNDQYLSYYKCSRKYSKWWMPVFMEMLDMAIVNARIHECFLRRNDESRKQEFRNELVVSVWEIHRKKNVEGLLNSEDQDLTRQNIGPRKEIKEVTVLVAVEVVVIFTVESVTFHRLLSVLNFGTQEAN